MNRPQPARYRLCRPTPAVSDHPGSARFSRRHAMAGLGGLAAADLLGRRTPRALAQTGTAIPATPDLASGIGDAAAAFLASLDEPALALATYPFADPERQRWHWTVLSSFPRNGLPLTAMREEQRELAFALLSASLSEAGYRKDRDIMSLQRDLGNDPQDYFVTIFGTPGAEPWGWRLEGHHLSRHFTVAGDRVSAVPFFLGALPTINYTGLRVMEREEEAARELVRSLLAAGRDDAVFQAASLTEHLTQNLPRVDPLDPVGVVLADVDAGQRTLALEIVDTYLGTLAPEVATTIFDRIDAAGLDTLTFGWAGSVEPRQPHYYRLQGPTFLLEFDNSRNSSAHIHSVWRDFEQDFGGDLM